MRIAYISTIRRHRWGGSEELWCRSAHALLQRGHEVAFSTDRYEPIATQLAALIDAGAMPNLRGKPPLGRRVRRALEKMRVVGSLFTGWLRSTKPDLVVISLSYHTDDMQYALKCHRLGIPYVLLLQAAGPGT